MIAAIPAAARKTRLTIAFVATLIESSCTMVVARSHRAAWDKSESSIGTPGDFLTGPRRK
jgi:hypothetical protein